MHPKILVYGDVMLDIFVTGAVLRDSPEAPGVPVLLMADMTEQPGGAANVAANVTTLGGRAMVMGVVGTDAPASVLESRLASLNVAMTFVVRPEGQTTSKTRFVANGRHLLRADADAHALLSPADEDGLLEYLRDLVPQSDAVVISDYAKGAVAPKVAEEVIAMARKRGIPVVVDAKAPHAPHFYGATVIKPNLKEIAIALGLMETPTTQDEAVKAACRLLWKSERTEYVLLTRGKQGMVLVGRHNTVVLPAYEVKQVDVTGAGDAVAAALALALARGDGIVEAAHFANAAGAVVVTKSGTVCPTPEEVGFFYDRDCGRHRVARSTMAQNEIPHWLH
jgi:D-beta-D-heptose 7-phosphate kinase / D-beta-D-heptose 1-phosphate adenosyltransferase